jgi:hypothetical protein
MGAVSQRTNLDESPCRFMGFPFRGLESTPSGYRERDEATAPRAAKPISACGNRQRPGESRIRMTMRSRKRRKSKSRSRRRAGLAAGTRS